MDVPSKSAHWGFCEPLSTLYRAGFPSSKKPNLGHWHHNQRKHHYQVLSATHPGVSPEALRHGEVCDLDVCHLGAPLMMVCLHHTLMMLHLLYYSHCLSVGVLPLDFDTVAGTGSSNRKYQNSFGSLPIDNNRNLITPLWNVRAILTAFLLARELDCSKETQSLQWSYPSSPFCRLRFLPENKRRNNISMRYRILTSSIQPRSGFKVDINLESECFWWWNYTKTKSKVRLFCIDLYCRS